MKKSFYISTTLLFVLLNIISCNNDESIIYNNENSSTNSIQFTTNLNTIPSSYADNEFNEGKLTNSKETENEKKINNLTIVIFDKNEVLVDIFSTIKLDNISTLTNNKGQYSLKLDKTDNMQYIALANISNDLLNTISQKCGTLDLFKTNIDEQNLNTRNSDDFLMTTESLNTFSTSETNIITLSRKAFRIDISNLTTKYNIKDITFKNQVIYSKIEGTFTSIPNNYYANTQTYNMNNDNTCSAKIYGYENNNKNSVLEVTYCYKNNTATYTQDIQLNLDLTSNTLYQIDIYNDESGLKDSIYVKDWNADEEYHVSNAELETKIKIDTIYGGGSCPSTVIAYNKKDCGIQYYNLSNYEYDDNYYTYKDKKYYISKLDLNKPLDGFDENNKKNKTQIRLRLAENGKLSCINYTGSKNIFKQSLVGTYDEINNADLDFNCTIHLKRITEDLIFKAEGSGHTRFFKIINIPAQ